MLRACVAEDYREALGNERPNVLPVSDSLYATQLSFRCGGVEYTAEIWVTWQSVFRFFFWSMRFRNFPRVCHFDVFRDAMSWRAEAASPEFRLALDYDRGIKVGGKSEAVPYVFHPAHMPTGIHWREQTWTELKVKDLPEHLQTHHKGAPQMNFSQVFL